MKGQGMQGPEGQGGGGEIGTMGSGDTLVGDPNRVDGAAEVPATASEAAAPPGTGVARDNPEYSYQEMARDERGNNAKSAASAPRYTAPEVPPGTPVVHPDGPSGPQSAPPFDSERRMVRGLQQSGEVSPAVEKKPWWRRLTGL